MSAEDRVRGRLGLGDLTCTLCDRGAAIALPGPWPQRFGPEGFAGRARTVRVEHGELAPVDGVLDGLAAGDVLVIRSGSDAAIWGGRLTARALERGAAGVVVDGSVRDVPILRRTTLPVTARAVAPYRSDAVGPGVVDAPLEFGPAAVRRGDLLVGDANGIVVIDRERVAEVAASLAGWLA